MSELSGSSVVSIISKGTASKGNAFFRVGETLFGKILGSVDGCVILSLCGENFMARTGLSFFPGESIRVRVEEKKKNRIVLKLLDTKNTAAKAQLDSSLKERVFSLEKSLRHLLGHFLAENIGESAGDRITDSLGTLIRALTSLKLFQQASKGKTGECIYLPIPIRVGDKCLTAEVKIFRRTKQGTSKAIDASNLKLAFLLDTANLGKVKILLDVINKHIKCQIDVENERTKKIISDYLPGLEQKLQGLGYPVDSIQFGSVSKDLESPLLLEEIGTDLVQVDIKV